MANATSDFDGWLADLDRTAAPIPLVQAMDEIACVAAQRFGARVWFVEIFGQRWSYIAGHVCDGPAVDAVSRIPLGAGFGLVAEGWGRLAGDPRDRFVAFVKQRVGAASHDPSPPAS